MATIVMTLFDDSEQLIRYEEQDIAEMLPEGCSFVRRVNFAPKTIEPWFDEVLHIEGVTPIIKYVVYDGTANDDIDPDKTYAKFIYEDVVRSYPEMVDVARNLDRKWKRSGPTRFIIGQTFLCAGL